MEKSMEIEKGEMTNGTFAGRQRQNDPRTNLDPTQTNRKGGIVMEEPKYHKEFDELIRDSKRVAEYPEVDPDTKKDLTDYL